MNILPLRFGIQEVDAIINPQSSDSSPSDRKIHWTAAIVGPDGCGKSILTLHLASNYWLENCQGVDPPRIIYVSTDLSHGQAESQWKSFGLNFPNARKLAIQSAYNHDKTESPFPDEEELCLSPLKPNPPATSVKKKDTLSEFFSQSQNTVHFLDLQSETAGDDWGFINHFVGLLPHRNAKENCARHLLIIDAVEGLEMFVGDRDAFGQVRDRRSRVAQLIRNASRVGAHVVLVVEESRDDDRLPEQFVADLVIRLRHPSDGGYSQRTIEIEKCRSIPHTRGQHEFAIRNGKGSYTGKYQHFDDPPIPWRNGNDTAFLDRDQSLLESDRFLAHLQVIRSVHRWNREVREERAEIPELIGMPSFDLEPLDSLMKQNYGKKEDKCQVSEGSLTFLLGDAGTHKGRLARRFLAQAFRSSSDANNVSTKTLGVAVLISTRLIDQPILVGKLGQHLGLLGTKTSKLKRIGKRVLCQRLSVRYLSSATFLNILSSYVLAAQCIVLQDTYTKRMDFDSVRKLPIEERRKASHRIRFVLEDWSLIQATHPNLANDPLLLESVLAMFKREGLSALIVSTQPGQPLFSGITKPHDLRVLDEQQIFTWTVPFFGDRRVAIAPLSMPVRSRATTISELSPQIGAKKDDLDDELLEIRRHFSLYADVDCGTPRRIPLVVRLYIGTHTGEGDSAGQFTKMVEDILSQVFPCAPDHRVVEFEPFTRYDGLFAFTNALDDANLDYSLVFQIDEFWSAIADSRHSLIDLSAYWVAPIEGDEDTYAGYNTHKNPGSKYVKKGIPWITHTISSRRKNQVLLRKDFFIQQKYGGPKDPLEVDRIPYLWDFGIILANRELWSKHRGLPISESQSGRRQIEVGDVWNSLCLDASKLRDGLQKRSVQTITWEQFLDACKTIAREEKRLGFDVDSSTVESLNCLFLEIWGSIESNLSIQNNTTTNFDTIVKRDGTAKNLKYMVKEFSYSLFLAAMQVISACPNLRASGRRVVRDPISAEFVASRQWYHTASALQRQFPEAPLSVLRLPGRYTVRGDWSLAVAAGSRSELLAHRAIDLLSSRRINLLRLGDGIGLPVRDIVPDDEMHLLRTALKTDGHAHRRVPVSYGDIVACGEYKDSKLKWLWRSQIANYGRDTFHFRRWIAALIEDQHQWFPPILSSADFQRKLTDVLIIDRQQRINNKLPVEFFWKSPTLRTALKGIRASEKLFEPFEGITQAFIATLRD